VNSSSSTLAGLLYIILVEGDTLTSIRGDLRETSSLGSRKHGENTGADYSSREDTINSLCDV